MLFALNHLDKVSALGAGTVLTFALLTVVFGLHIEQIAAKVYLRIESCNMKCCLARVICGIDIYFELEKDLCTSNGPYLCGSMQWTGSIDTTLCIGDKTFLEHISETFWVIVENDVMDD